MNEIKTLSLLRQSPSTTGAALFSALRARTLPLLAVLGLIGWQASRLMLSPPPHVDEAWDANRAWALLQTGRAFGTMDSGVLEHYPGYWTYFPWLGTAIHALALWVGGLQLESLRVESLMFGILLLGIMYLLARNWVGSRGGWAAVILLGLSTPFTQASHLGRVDIIVAAMGYGAAWLLLDTRPAHLYLRTFAAGLLATLALDVHLGAAMFLPPLVLSLAVRDGIRLWRNPRAYLLALGMLGGVAWFAAFHLIPYPGTFAAILPIGAAGVHTPLPLNPSVWPVFATWLVRWFGTVAQLQALLLLPAGRLPGAIRHRTACPGILRKCFAVLRSGLQRPRLHLRDLDHACGGPATGRLACTLARRPASPAVWRASGPVSGAILPRR